MPRSSPTSWKPASSANRHPHERDPRLPRGSLSVSPVLPPLPPRAAASLSRPAPPPQPVTPTHRPRAQLRRPQPTRRGRRALLPRVAPSRRSCVGRRPRSCTADVSELGSTAAWLLTLWSAQPRRSWPTRRRSCRAARRVAPRRRGCARRSCARSGCGITPSGSPHRGWWRCARRRAWRADTAHRRQRRWSPGRSSCPRRG